MKVKEALRWPEHILICSFHNIWGIHREYSGRMPLQRTGDKSFQIREHLVNDHLPVKMQGRLQI